MCYASERGGGAGQGGSSKGKEVYRLDILGVETIRAAEEIALLRAPESGAPSCL